jgi:hypothetical protein
VATTGLQFPGIDAAIAAFEGYNTQGTIAQRQNNPGNLVAGTFASTYGGTGSPGQIATFPTAAQGAAAEDALIQNYAEQGYSIQDLINTWAPATAPGNTPQSTQNYINFVANAAGVSPTTSLEALAPSNTSGSIATVLPNLGSSTVPTSNLGLPQTAPYNLQNQPLYCNIPGVGLFASACQASQVPGNPFVNSAGQTTCGISNISGCFSGFSWGRIGAFVLGILLVIGAVFLFKPGVENVVSKGKGALGFA